MNSILKSRGFSLLETLTALTILAISLGALFGNYSGSLKGAQRSKEYTKARILAQSLMAENITRNNFKKGSSVGRYQGYNWEVKISPLKNEWAKAQNSKKWQLLEINISVKWGKRSAFQLRRLKLGRLNE